MLRAGQRVWRALLTARPFLAAPHGRAWTPAFRVCSSSPSSNASKPSTANAPTDASTDQFHSCFGVVDFLINKIGLNTAAAQRMVTRFPPLLSVDPKSLDHTVNFLKSLGCSAEDMRKVLARCPSLAGQHPRKYDEQIAFLRSFGLTRENIRKVVVQMPQVLQLRQDTLRSRLRYLNQTLGLPREKICRVITKHPQVMQLSVAESLDSRAQSLAELLDMDVLDVGRLVYRHPQVLSSNLEVLAQRVDFYRDLGIDVRRLFSRCPQVLNLRIDEHVAPRIEQIRDKFGLPTDRTARLILQMPQVLTLSWDTINIRIDFLKSIGMRSSQMVRVITNAPQVFQLSVDESLKEKVRFLTDEAGIDKDDVPVVIAKLPRILTYSIDNGLRKKITYWREEIGLAPHEVAQLVRMCPMALSLDIDKNIAPKIRFLYDEANETLQDTVLRGSSFLMYSLEGRIRPRFEFLRSKNIQKSVSVYLVPDDKTFAEKVCKSNLAEYQAFVREKRWKTALA